MSYHLLLVCLLGSTGTALKLNADTGTALKPTTDVSDSLELWNRTAFMLFGPYWAQHGPAQRTVMLRQLLSSGHVSDDLVHKVTLIQSEKLRRAHRMKETGVEVIPGCGQGKPCTAKSYYQAVLASSRTATDDDCCEILYGDCLTQSMQTCMKVHWDPEKDMNNMDVSLITEWDKGPSTEYNAFSVVRGLPNSAQAHAHSLLQKSGSGDHGGCPKKSCDWCVAHGYSKNGISTHVKALTTLTETIAPSTMTDQICFIATDKAAGVIGR